MSFTAHIRTKSKIEYGSRFFNHEQYELKKFIEESGFNVYAPEYNEDYWEIDRDQLEGLVKYIDETYNDNEECFGGYTREDLISIFNKWLEETSNRSNFDFPDTINIDWF